MRRARGEAKAAADERRARAIAAAVETTFDEHLARHGGHPPTARAAVVDAVATELGLRATALGRIYRTVAAPLNAELTRHALAGSVPSAARALQTRWDSVIVARVLLIGFAVLALAAALVGSAQ